MTDSPASASVSQAALRGLACKCPRCGEGRLYAGFLTLRPSCNVCGLDYAFIDAGDGNDVIRVNFDEEGVETNLNGVTAPLSLNGAEGSDTCSSIRMATSPENWNATRKAATQTASAKASLINPRSKPTRIDMITNPSKA